jgi:flagella basal body P-ring formation protein FlgA
MTRTFLFLVALALAWGTGVNAAAPVPANRNAAPLPSGSPVAQAEHLLRERVDAQAQALGARVEITLGSVLDDRLSRAPCQPEVFLPPGTRVWGKTYIGLRCATPNWQVRVPVDVALYVSVPMFVRPMSPGSIVQPGDWTYGDVDMAAWPRGVVTDDKALAGSRIVRQARVGEPIPPDALQSGARMASGAPVQVVLIGPGFMIKAAGKLLQQATPGQSTRVQLESGRTVAGTMRDDREIEVNL